MATFVKKKKKKTTKTDEQDWESCTGYGKAVLAMGKLYWLLIA